MIERRTTTSAGPVQLAKRANGEPLIRGLAAVFYNPLDKGTEYKLRPGLVERISRGAFDRVLAKRPDVLSLFNHDPSLLLARTAANTLRLSVTDRGLLYEVTPVDTSLTKDVIAHLRVGNIAGSSFSFTVSAGERLERQADGTVVRWLDSFDGLYDASPVSTPAYTSTTAGVDEPRCITPEAIAVRLRVLELDCGR